MVHPIIQRARGLVKRLESTHSGASRKLREFGTHHEGLMRQPSRISLRELRDRLADHDPATTTESHKQNLNNLEKSFNDLESRRSSMPAAEYKRELSSLETEAMAEARSINESRREANQIKEKIDQLHSEHTPILNPSSVKPEDLVSFEKGQAKINEEMLRQHMEAADKLGVPKITKNELRAALREKMNRYYETLGTSKTLSGGLRTNVERFHTYMKNVMPVRYGLLGTAATGLGLLMTAQVFSSALGGSGRVRDVKDTGLESDLNQLAGTASGMLISLQQESKKFVKLKTNKNSALKSLGESAEKLVQVIENNRNLALQDISAENKDQVRNLNKGLTETTSSVQQCMSSCETAISFIESKLSSITDETKKQMVQNILDKIKSFKSNLEVANDSLVSAKSQLSSSV